MEWTGARYADSPTVEVETAIAAPPGVVWDLVADVTAMPSTSNELQSVEWLDGATGPAVGARFLGRSRHDALGEWEIVSHVTECVAPQVLAWAVEDAVVPAATWRFTLEPDGEGVILRQWMQLGPGPSGLSKAIERMPEKEQKIVFVRLREFEANMTATLAALKEQAESVTGH